LPAWQTDQKIGSRFRFFTSINEWKSVSVEQLKGKALIINFWATWCGPCLVEMPFVAKLFQSVIKMI
jgi:thiol-disulfide isomerase/thioredoxin